MNNINWKPPVTVRAHGMRYYSGPRVPCQPAFLFHLRSLVLLSGVRLVCERLTTRIVVTCHHSTAAATGDGERERERESDDKVTGYHSRCWGV
jgi:hypothetical protein